MRALLFFAFVVVVAAQQDCLSCVQQQKFWCPSKSECGAKSETCDIKPISVALNCPRAVQPQYAYNESFARGYAAPYTSAVYAPDSGALCFKNVLPNTVIYKTVRVKCDKDFPEKEVHCQAYTAYDPSLRAIIVAFQGTDGGIQLTEEVLSFLTQHKSDFFGVGKVMGYFYNAFFDLWNGGLQQAVSTLQFEHPGYELWVFGHSLGGAMASVQAAYAVQSGIITPDKIKLITCGQPRTGDYDYATWMETNVPYNFRLIHHHDLVPHIPPRLGPDALFHHRSEVWYNNDMSVGQPYKVCDEADGDYCSNTIVSLSGADHDLYFHPLGSWARNGCQ